MAKKKQEKLDAGTLAISLGVVRNHIAELKKEDLRLTTLFKEALHAEQLTEAGDYQISKVFALKVANESIAIPWAQANNCITEPKVDVSKAKEILRHTFDDPSKFGFAVVESERISPKGGRDEE